MASDVNELRNQYHESVAKFVTGDTSFQKPLWSQRDDVTLANPLGPPAKGVDRVYQALDHAASLTSEGEDWTFEPISTAERSDLAYDIGIERCRARLGGAGDKVRISLRVTTGFRREDDGWKIVHRHADPITDRRPIESVVAGSK